MRALDAGSATSTSKLVLFIGHGGAFRHAASQLGLLSPADRGIQCAEAAVAVRLEWAHAQFFGQGQGLAVVAGGGLDLGRCLARQALAQEPQGPGLGATLLVLAGEIISLLSALACRWLLSAIG